MAGCRVPWSSDLYLSASKTIKSRRGRPPGTDGEATRRIILDVALQQFAELGFSSATLSKVAELAGITPSAMYYYYDSKSALFEAVFFDVAPKQWKTIGPMVEDSTSVREVLETLFRSRGGQRPPYVSKFMASMPTVAKLHPEFSHLLKARAEFQAEGFSLIAKMGVDNGEFEGFTIDEATEVIRTIVIGWFFERYLVGEDRDSSIEPLLKAFDRIIGR